MTIGVSAIGNRPRLRLASNHADASPRPRVVSELTVAKKLAKTSVDIRLIDRENHHLFQPLLYQEATAGLSPADIAWPIRRLVRSQKNTRAPLGEVTSIDETQKRVYLGNCEVGSDVLVLAAGATHGYFGNDDWVAHAPGLKAIDDATEIRRRMLLAFERAEMERDAEKRRRLLTIVIVGGGPTGVKMAGTVVERARKALAVDFRDVDPGQAHAIMVEAGPRVLPGFPEHISHYAADALAHLGVDVRLGDTVAACDVHGVWISNKRIAAETVICAAGVRASPAAAWLGLESDRAGRVPLASDLKPPNTDDIFVIGDTALVHDAARRPLPGIAPVAKQQGAYVADAIKAQIADRPAPPPLRYRDRGQLATISRKAAVIVFRRLRLKGCLAWWLWGIAHIYFLISPRNRLIVATQWLWSNVSFERGAWLITGTRIRTVSESADRRAGPVTSTNGQHAA